MGLFPLFFRLEGRIGPRIFVRGIVAVYLAGVVSQLLLLSGPVLARAGSIPFVVIHAVLIWCWLSLHLKRAREAGASIPTTAGVAALYMLTMFVFVAVVDELFKPGLPEAADRAMRENPAAQLPLVVTFTVLFEIWFKQDWSWEGWFYKSLSLVPFVPALLAIGYSIWVARRPAVSEPKPEVKRT